MYSDLYTLAKYINRSYFQRKGKVQKILVDVIFSQKNLLMYMVLIYFGLFTEYIYINGFQGHQSNNPNRKGQLISKANSTVFI